MQQGIEFYYYHQFQGKTALKLLKNLILKLDQMAQYFLLYTSKCDLIYVSFSFFKTYNLTYQKPFTTRHILIQKFWRYFLRAAYRSFTLFPHVYFPL